MKLICRSLFLILNIFLLFNSFSFAEEESKHVIVAYDYSNSMGFNGVTDDNIEEWNSFLIDLLYSDDFDPHNYSEFNVNFDAKDLKFPLLKDKDLTTFLKIRANLEIPFDNQPKIKRRKILGELPTKRSNFGGNTNLIEAEHYFLQRLDDDFNTILVMITDNSHHLGKPTGNSSLIREIERINNEYHVANVLSLRLFKDVSLVVRKIKFDYGNVLEFQNSYDQSHAVKFAQDSLNNDLFILSPQNTLHISTKQDFASDDISYASIKVHILDSDLNEILKFDVAADQIPYGLDSIEIKNANYLLEKSDQKKLSLYIKAKYKYKNSMINQDLTAAPGIPVEFVKYIKPTPPVKPPYWLLVIILIMGLPFLFVYGKKKYEKNTFTIKCHELERNFETRLGKNESLYLGKNSFIQRGDKIFDLDSKEYKIVHKENAKFELYKRKMKLEDVTISKIFKIITDNDKNLTLSISRGKKKLEKNRIFNPNNNK